MMSDILIEWNGRRRRVSVSQLFAYARKGIIGPETRIWYHDRESVCGRVKGIVFANEIPSSGHGWSRRQVVPVPQTRHAREARADISLNEPPQNEPSQHENATTADESPNRCVSGNSQTTAATESGETAQEPYDFIFEEDSHAGTRRVVLVCMFALMIFLGLAITVTVCLTHIFNSAKARTKPEEATSAQVIHSTQETSADPSVAFATESFDRNIQNVPVPCQGHDLARIFRTLEIRDEDQTPEESTLDYAKRIAAEESQPLYGEVGIFSTFAFTAHFEYDGTRYNEYHWSLAIDSLLAERDEQVILRLENERNVCVQDYLDMVKPQRRDQIRQSQYSNYGVRIVPPDGVTSSFPQGRVVRVVINDSGEYAPAGGVRLLVVGRLCRDPHPTATNTKKEIPGRYIGVSRSSQTNYVFMLCPSFWVYNDATGKVYARFSYEQLLGKDIDVNVPEENRSTQDE
ncbi:MAG: hypothetical protein PHQ75_02485 [Thermoguttaceae bacterium]|nr:hypothetical protein [Thermoguttaceae bacterium]